MKHLVSYLGFQRVLMAWLVLFLAGLACSEGVSPSDPRIPPIADPYITILTNYLVYLRGLPAGQIPQPMIVEPKSPVTSREMIAIWGYGPNATDMQSANPPQVTLYAVRPVDCSGRLIKMAKLGDVLIDKTDSPSSELRKWLITGVNLPTDAHFLAATVTVDGKEGPLSDPLVFDLGLVMPTIQKPLQGQAVGKIFSISGKALPNLCLTLYRDDSQVTDQLIRPIDANLGQPIDWVIKVPQTAVREGQNNYFIQVKGIPTIPTVSLQVSLEMPTLLWPFGMVENGIYKSEATYGCVTAWSGTNDWHLQNSKYPVHTGMDIACKDTIPDGSVHAVADGKVFVADTVDDSDVGINLAIDHGAWISWYMHLESLAVGNGVTVNAGDIVGTMGTTGYSTGEHLHLELLWWGDVGKKDEFIAKSPNAVRQPGYTNTNINLNKPDLVACAGVQSLWRDLDWYRVSIPNNYTGTKFDICTSKNTCICLGE